MTSQVTRAQVEVEAMIELGLPFESIESYIEELTELTNYQRNALWLLAWVSTSEDQRREVVRELLAA